MFVAKQFTELTLEELKAIYIARSRVFTVGQELTVKEPDLVDRVAVHLFTQDDAGQVLAYMRLINLETIQDSHYQPIPGAYSLSCVAVVPEARGTGLGKSLLEEDINWVRKNTTAQKIVISAQAYLKDSYYAPAGFIQQGKEFQEAGLPHVTMVLELA